MAKALKDILAGTKSSTETPMNLDDLQFSDGAKSVKGFVAKHKIEKHADRVGNGDDVYKSKLKKVDHKSAPQDAYEEVDKKKD